MELIDPKLALDIVWNSQIIAFDTETTGLGIDARVCGWVFANFEHSVYVPVRHAGGNVLNVEEFERVLALAFKDRARRGYLTVGHNLGFDLRLSARHKVYPEYPLEDTMINESLICDITRGYGLDDCCPRYKVTQKKGGDLYAEMAKRFGGLPDRKQMGNFWKMPGDHPLVIEYACGDGISTLELRAAQQKKLDEEDLRKPWDLECRLIHRVARLHERGLRVNMNYALDLLDPKCGLLQAEIDKASAVFPAGFNTNSPKGVEALYRANGYVDTDFARTDNGAVSFTEAWLKTNDIGEQIIAVRQLKKARDSFVMPLAMTHNVGGRVHPVLNQSKSDEYGAMGARFSCSEPNLQAFPKRNKKVGKLVRKLVIPDDEFDFIEADAKQQEPRLFGHFSEDETLCRGYLHEGLDMHDMTMNWFKLDRDTAKRMGMGLLTGMSAETLARHMKFTSETAQFYWNKFFDLFPGIRRFHVEAKSIFKHTGFVKSILGRKARLDDPRFAYRAISRIIQNSGGDHIKMCLLRACEYEESFPDLVQILLTIHDSIEWQQIKGFDNTELIKVLENVAHELKLLLPIPFEVGKGADWSIASYGG